MHRGKWRTGNRLKSMTNFVKYFLLFKIFLLNIKEFRGFVIMAARHRCYDFPDHLHNETLGKLGRINHVLKFNVN